MTENIRFTYGAAEPCEDVLIDHLTKKTYSLYDLDVVCNKLWEQTQRFEKHNQELVQRSMDYEDKIDELINDNKHLRQLAEGNEEHALTVMSYLHDNYYDVWEEVNKECFL